MGYNNKVWRALQKSRHIDVDKLKELNPVNVECAPVNPEVFEASSEKIIITSLVNDVLNFAKDETEKHRTECAVLLCGKKHSPFIYLTDPYMERGEAYSASYSTDQMKCAGQTIKFGGEVCYAHTHVTRGSSYKCFSVNDLAYLVTQALNAHRDAYGMLITSDGTMAIKFDHIRSEFYRVEIEIR